MSTKYEGIIQIGFPFEVDTNKPIDSREVVSTFNNLLSLDYLYEGIIIYVEDEKMHYKLINSSSYTSSGGWEVVGGGNDIDTSSLATTGSNTFIGNQIITGSINIIENLTSSYIKSTGSEAQYYDFDTVNTSSVFKSGRMTWNAAKGTMDLNMGYDGVNQQIGMEQYYPPVTNKTNDGLYNGMVVMVNPSQIVQGERYNVIKAVADGTYSAKLILGMLTMDLPHDQTGFVTKFGEVHDLSISTLETHNIKQAAETWIAGQILYINPIHAGGLTNIEPTAPNLKCPVATIQKLTGDNLDLFVRFEQTFALDELHNVYSTGKTSGDILIWNSGSNRYETTKQLTGSYGLTGSFSLISGSYYGAVSFNPSGNITATNVQTAIEELDAEKQPKTLYFSNKSVLTTDFVADATYAGYGYKAVIACAGVTSTMLTEVAFAPTEADSGNYAAVCLSGTGTVTIYSKSVPSGTITIPTIKSETV